MILETRSLIDHRGLPQDKRSSASLGRHPAQRMRQAFLFAPTNNALAGQWSTNRCNHRTLAIPVGSIEVQHGPVVRAMSFTGSRGIGKQRGIMSIAALSVQHGQPRLTFRIEAAWRNGREPSVMGGDFQFLERVDAKRVAMSSFSVAIVIDTALAFNWLWP